MHITWLEKEDLIPTVLKKLENVDIMLDIGCGIRPQRFVRPLVHICCEPFGQYVENLREKIRDEYDRTYVILKATWADALELFPPKSVDSVFLIDVIEHLEKEEALRLLKATEALARRQITVFTPLGFMPQHHPDGEDAWGLGGGVWQEHRSGWRPEEFDDSWDVYASRVFHTIDNLGRELETPYGALWAIKTLDKVEEENREISSKKEKIRTMRTVVDMVIDIRLDALVDLFILLMRVLLRIKNSMFGRLAIRFLRRS